MPYTRHYYKFIVCSIVLLRTCFGQSSCLPLYGTDTNHPNGLFLPVATAKQYAGAKQNSSPMYVFEFAAGAQGAGQALWDPIQGPQIVSFQQAVSAARNAVFSCAPTPVQGPPQAVPYYKTPLASSYQILAVADFNRDGINDIAVLAPGTNQVWVYLGNADRTFQTPVTTTVGTASTRLTSIGLLDFNNDRKVDIAVVDTVNNAVYLLYGKGDGTFYGKSDGQQFAPVTVPVGKSPVSLVVTDINADTIPDLVVTNSADNTVSVLRGNVDNTFLPASVLAVGKNPVSAIVQDMNGDGNLDVVVADSGSNDIAVLYGLGNGGFQNAVFVKTPAPPTVLASADFGNDGFPDVIALSGDLNAIMMINGSFQGKLSVAGTYLVPNLAASFSINDFNSDGNLDVLITDTDTGELVLLLGRGDGTLIAPPVYAGSNGIGSLTTGDLNGDGNLDLVVTGSNATTSSLSFLTGLGNGQFQPPVNVPVGGRTDVAAAGDFNRDGKADIAVSGAQLNILLNQGNGVFQQGAQYPNLTPSVVADFNKDGRPDLAGPFNGGLGVMLGNGDGTFRAANQFAVGSNPKTALTADFNRDGSADLAVLNAGTPGSAGDPGGVSIVMGNGTGTFAAAINIQTGFNPRAMAVGDVNGDGKPDLLVATAMGASGAAASSYQISVFLGKGDGTFQVPFSVPVPVGETPGALAALDLDGDGYADLVLGDCCTDATTAYYRGNGDGTFQPATPFYGGNNVRAMVVGDWNGDGKQDLAMGYSPATLGASSTLGGVASLTNHATVVQALTITSGASFLSGPIAPDGIHSAFGTNLTNVTDSATGDPSALPTVLSGTTVTVVDSKGVSRPARLYYVSPTQVNFLVPTGTALGTAKVSVAGPNGVTATQVNVINTVPGMFTAGGLAAGGGVRVSGGQQTTFNFIYTDPFTGFISAVPIFLGAKTDQTFLTLYGTGIRNRGSLDGVVITVGGVYTPALYAGAQSQFPGLDQLNFQIPYAVAGMGPVTVQVTVDGVKANPVTIVVQ